MLLDPGSDLVHSTFGAGTVLSTNGRHTVIRFGGVERTFATEVVATMVAPPRPVSWPAPSPVPVRTVAPVPTPAVVAPRPRGAGSRKPRRGALEAAAKAIGWPRWMVRSRGVALGLTRTKELPWSLAEIEVLELYEHLGVEAMQRRLAGADFHRTLAAINLKIKRLGLREHRDWYSAWKLAQAFGLDQKLVVRWIRRGWLKAERRGTNRKASQGSDSWLIMHVDVKPFVLAHPEEIDLAHVEKFWFLELLTDGQITR